MAPQQNDGDPADGSGLSIVVPVHNEARRLPGTLPRMIEYAKSLDESVEILVVDDGSTDDTAGIAASIGKAQGVVTVLRSDRNRGKGAAVRRGMLAARLGHVLFTDVDLSTPLEEAAKLRAALTDQSRRPDGTPPGRGRSGSFRCTRRPAAMPRPS